MEWKKVFEKGLKGIVPALLALLASQAEAITGFFVAFIPEQLAGMTVAGVVAFLVNGGANWLKHRND